MPVNLFTRGDKKRHPVQAEQKLNSTNVSIICESIASQIKSKQGMKNDKPDHVPMPGVRCNTKIRPGLAV